MLTAGTNTSRMHRRADSEKEFGVVVMVHGFRNSNNGYYLFDHRAGIGTRLHWSTDYRPGWVG